MTAASIAVRDRRRPATAVLDAVAPAERLAAFRIALGAFTFGYLIVRLSVFLGLGERSAGDFDPVGLLAPLASPPRAWMVNAAVAVTIVGAAATAAGWRHRVAAPITAIGMLLLATLRGSWGQMLHFENLIVLHLLIVAFAPAADAWSVDAHRRLAGSIRIEPSERYGWPLSLAGLVTAITYVIAGIAKLRYGGLDWVFGDTLRNHVAYSAARLDLIGGTPPVLAEFAIRQSWALPVFAAVAVSLELSAPVALLGGRIRTTWVVAAWLMHVGIYLTMAVGFPAPLFGIAFAPFFALERIPWCLRPSRSGDPR